MDGELSDLRTGQRVVILSGHDESGTGLEARYIWTKKPLKFNHKALTGGVSSFLGFGKKAAPSAAALTALYSGRWEETPGKLKELHGLLEHSGPLRQLSDDQLIIADLAYTVNWIPLGGFVRLAGENNDERIPGSLAVKPIWQRAVIISSGAAINAVFPLLAFTVMFMMPHQNIVSDGPVTVQEVMADSPAAQAGLRPGDTITHVGERPVAGPQDLLVPTDTPPGESVTYRVVRDGESQPVRVVPRRRPDESLPKIGITVGNTFVRQDGKPPWQALPQSVDKTGELFATTGEAMAGTIQGEIEPDVRGPIGIAQLSGLITLQFGIQGWLLLALIISLNMAIFNILPIPMLDGGRLFLLLVEACRGGRKISAEKERLIHLVGLAILLVVICAVMVGDIGNLISGANPLG